MIIGNIDIQQPIHIIVEEDGPKTRLDAKIFWFDSCCLSHIKKSAIPVISIQEIGMVTGDKKIQISVVVKIYEGCCTS